MILGIGIDLVEISRLERALCRWGDRLTQRLFTPEEWESCASKARQREWSAGRLAAKEAFLKALGTGLAHGIRWRDVEILRGESGEPRIRLAGRAQEIFEEMRMTRAWLSLSHQGGFSVAVVVLEGNGHEA